ncbi:helix-turn-helix transcriptional regulator [Shewanella sp. 202IG2-18]|uniref:AraC family transcriptional regulator n=1 Tax=Parashewanella hymeniacidonis TaxID=2807618 RepID=UPI0019613348|nr:helix-turn-helix transcriptional regulator [Parashewanella hymeniacidonis]MBM7070640.1 helix-turn-helix transcriptional regulator [Parashewanella hymeniacidonis]
MKTSSERYQFQLLEQHHNVQATGNLYQTKQKVIWHQHSTAQFLYAASGVIRVTTHQGCWVAPSLRAIWIPANTEHQLEIVKAAAVKSLLITEQYQQSHLPTQCQVITVSSLLREIVLHCHSQEWPVDAPQNQRLIEVFFDQIKLMSVEPLLYPKSSHPKIKLIINHFLEQPHVTTSIEHWANNFHMSVRSLSRLFSKEMNMGYRQCRLQIRLIRAIELLAQNKSVTEVSYSLGFSNESNFIRLFKSAFGVTPKQYFNANC